LPPPDPRQTPVRSLHCAAAGLREHCDGRRFGALDGASCRIESEQIGAPDELVQLAVVDQRARIEIGVSAAIHGQPDVSHS
jgi:hypothetical protein